MRLNAQRLGLLFASFLLLAVALAACSTPAASTTTGSGTGDSGNVFQTPNPNLSSPTPTFPGFTVGAWPSNYSPNNNDNLTIYVMCRIQDPSMQNPPRPAPGVSVVLTFQNSGPASVNLQPLQGTTGPDGIAAFNFPLNDPTSGVPIIVSASATFQGVTYTAQTFFTPNPDAVPSPSATPPGGGKGGGGHPTPTSTP
jgi:hypothetical protein